jgi:phosphate/sulfate permease
MTGITVLIALTLICGFYVAWNIGANDVANAMGTSVGSGALTLRRAVLLAALFEFAGAYIVGSNVSNTVRKKIFDPSEITRVYGVTQSTVTIDVFSKDVEKKVFSQNDFLSTRVGKSASANILTNDISRGESELTAVAVESETENGKFTIQTDGSLEYVPNAGFVGDDSIEYEVRDSNGTTEKGTVSVLVGKESGNPIAGADHFVAFGNNAVEGNVLSNDLDIESWNLNTSPESKPENGTVKLNRDGTFTYTPNEGFVGSDSFSYAVSSPMSSYVLACGMIAALLAAGTWLLIATWMSWPVSTTHSIVGAVVGFGFIALGYGGIAWGSVGMISIGWVVSPVISGAISYLLFSAILKMVFHKRDPVRAAKRLTPYLVAAVLAVLSGVTTFKGLKPLWKNMGIDYDPFGAENKTFLYSVLGITALISIIGFFITKAVLKNYGNEEGEEAGESGGNPVLDAEVSRSLHKAQMHLKRVRSSSADEKVQLEAERLLEEVEQVSKTVREKITTNTDSPELRKVEKIFVLLQILTACLVAFAHGSNDVANAIGPLSAAYQALQEGVVSAKSTTPGWALLLGGVGIVLGLATWGWRVIQTVGEKITELTPSRGFCAEFGAAITILVASTLPIGLPISTTHTLVGAVLGVGLARGINALNLKTMRDIVAGWAITIPAGAGLAIVFYLIMKAVFIDSGWVS